MQFPESEDFPLELVVRIAHVDVEVYRLYRQLCTKYTALMDSNPMKIHLIIRDDLIGYIFAEGCGLFNRKGAIIFFYKNEAILKIFHHPSGHHKLGDLNFFIGSPKWLYSLCTALTFYSPCDVIQICIDKPCDDGDQSELTLSELPDGYCAGCHGMHDIDCPEQDEIKFASELTTLRRILDLAERYYQFDALFVELAAMNKSDGTW